ncbi:MAG TPA: cupin domain-containing protein [Puia sp.]|nr:cupin domain-containing protein [Puia sp.]
MKLSLCLLSVGLFCAVGVCAQEPVRRFDADALRQELTGKKGGRLDLLNEKTLQARIRRIGKTMRESARDDLACIVVAGKGKFRIGGLTGELSQGSMLYIPKDSVCEYFDIEEPIDVMEWSSRGEMKSMGSQPMRPAAPGPAVFTLDGVRSARIPGENVWNAFVRRPSMILGLYMLPKSVGGDSALVHKWDEINLITRGTGKFQVGNDVMDVRPGDIIYVRKGNPHWFHTLGQDLDILIFFEMASMGGK